MLILAQALFLCPLMVEPCEAEQIGLRLGAGLEVGVKSHPEIDERVRITMEARHRNALILLEIEEILTFYEQEDKKYIGTLNQQELEGALFDLRDKIFSLLERMNLDDSEESRRQMETIKLGINRYFMERLRIYFVEQSLRKEVRKHSLTDSTLALGGYLFELKTGGKRIHNMVKIAAERQGAYLIARFNSPVDYNRFTGAQEERYGQYHESFDLADEKGLKLITINGFKGLEHVSEHERQHFFNELVFGRFSSIEPPYQHSDFYPNLSAALMDEGGDRCDLILSIIRRVKDELLAFIKEGEEVDILFDYIASLHLTRRLKENLSQIEFFEFEQLMQKIKFALKSVLEIFDTHERRALLIYLLIDVPLPLMPEALESIRIFYEDDPSLLIDSFAFEANLEAFEQARDLRRRGFEILAPFYKSGKAERAILANKIIDAKADGYELEIAGNNDYYFAVRRGQKVA